MGLRINAVIWIIIMIVEIFVFNESLMPPHNLAPKIWLYCKSLLRLVLLFFLSTLCLVYELAEVWLGCSGLVARCDLH